MGRSYQAELSELRAAQASVPQAVIGKLREQAALAADHGLIVVASGGAKVVAEWACHLQRTVFGSSAVAMTPLDYVSLASPVRAVTWFVSAGGRHPDIRQAAAAAETRGDACCVGFIGHLGTPLGEWLKEKLRADVVEFDLTGEGDGFLATSSVWAMSCALAQAYSGWLDSDSLDGDVFEELRAWGEQAACETARDHAAGRDLVLLHDSWTSLAANDLETRLIETALANIWSADLRNFAHGRHFWAADRADRTSLIAITTPASNTLAQPTVDLLPASLPVRAIQVPFEGIAGALAALSWSIHLTAEIGKQIGRDPGRPGVPAFGEKLYAGGYPYPRRTAMSQVERAIFRKSPAIQPGGPHAKAWEGAYREAKRRFESARVPAIVADYDGTLVDSPKRFEPIPASVGEHVARLVESGIYFGVATGRGDSVRKELIKVVPEPLWPRVVVGYHNGAVVLGLHEDIPDLDGGPATPDLLRASRLLQSEVANRGLCELRSRAHQLTVTPAKGLPLLGAWRATRECLDRHGLSSIPVWLSSHSVDVLGPQCSKLNVVARVAELAGCSSEEVLRLGDRGARPGNDWELLSAPLGFSVGDCSSEMKVCWNLLPPDLHGAAGTAYLLAQIKSLGTTGDHA
ncbi:MAG: HAD hydrolase family protein [Pseudomonadota bacterium]|nr:HAD hydrolase family protein [Pseudomonadota bacterium]